MQRAAIDTASQFVVGASRLFEGMILSDSNKSIEGRLQRPDVAQGVLYQLNRGCLARPQAFTRLFDSHSPDTAGSERITAGSRSGDSCVNKGWNAALRPSTTAAALIAASDSDISIRIPRAMCAENTLSKDFFHAFDIQHAQGKRFADQFLA